MLSKRRPLAAVAAAALALTLLAPLPTRADETPPRGDGSPLGVVFAVLCGAGVSISRLAPGVPIVVVVTAVSCLGMFIDGFASPDP